MAALIHQLTHLDDTLAAVEGVTEALKQEPVTRLLVQPTERAKHIIYIRRQSRKARMRPALMVYLSTDQWVKSNSYFSTLFLKD